MLLQRESAKKKREREREREREEKGGSSGGWKQQQQLVVSLRAEEDTAEAARPRERTTCVRALTHTHAL